MTQAGDGPDGTVDAPAGGLVPAGDPDPGTDLVPAGDAAPAISTFSLDNRAVPGLYVAAWAGIIVGGGLLVVGSMAVGSSAAPWLFLVGLMLAALGLIAASGSQAIERRRQPDLAYTGPSPVLVFLAILALTPLAQLVVLAPLSAIGLDPRSPFGTTINLALQTLLYVGMLRLVVVGTGALHWREMGVVPPSAAQLRDLALGALVAVPVLVLTLLLGAFMSRFIEPAPSQLPTPQTVADVLFNLVSAAVLAPIGEELFFRGFATTAWDRAVGRRPAIVRGAVFFALVHVLTQLDAAFATGAQHALYAFVGLLPVAVTLGWLFLGRRSLYAPIGLHAAYNAIGVLLISAASLR